MSDPLNQWHGQFMLGGAAQQIAVGQNADGRLEIFYVGTNNNLYHRWQTEPNGLFWSAETLFKTDNTREITVSAQQVAVGRNLDGRLEIFYVGTNNKLYHNWQTQPNGDWHGEVQFANDSAQQVAVGANTDGRLEIFYVGTNNNLYHNWQTQPNGNWHGETQFGDNSAYQVVVGANTDDRLEIFYVGTNNDLYHNWQIKPADAWDVTSLSAWAGEKQFATDSANQVAVGRNADGRLEIFYVGTNNDLYHNWQLKPATWLDEATVDVWAGEMRFPGESAKQLAVGRNADGRLEIFYVGTNNELYHNWQKMPANWENPSTLNAWAGETPFQIDDDSPGTVSANQVAVGQNADGRLEIFYVGPSVGPADNIYQNWQAAQPKGLGSNSNQYVYRNYNFLTRACDAIIGLKVTVDVTKDIVCRKASGLYGFSFQLNAYSPSANVNAAGGYKCGWQQYVITLVGDDLTGGVNNWPIMPTAMPPNSIIDQDFYLASPPAKIPAGYKLEISLQNDAQNNITGATYVVIDGNGKTLASVAKVLMSFDTVTSADLAPIIAFQFNIVGPFNGEAAVLSSGAGTITYQAANDLTVTNSRPKCAETDVITAETANTIYSVLPSTPSTTLSQSFSVSSIESLMIRRWAKFRTRLTIPRSHRRR